MRWNHVRNVLLSVGALVLAVGCARLVPVQNIENQPVSANKPSVTLDEIGNAIVLAGSSLNLRMQKVRPGLIFATFSERERLRPGSPIPAGVFNIFMADELSAVMEIKYDSKRYSILYKESQGFNYDGRKIHKDYNSWVQRLDQRVRVQLSLL
jgi:hypothetical protein